MEKPGCGVCSKCGEVIQCPECSDVSESGLIALLDAALDKAAKLFNDYVSGDCPMSLLSIEPWPEGCKEKCGDENQDVEECWKKFFTCQGI